MEATLSGLQIDILSKMTTLGPQRVNRALGVAEIAEVLSGQNLGGDIRQLYAAIQSELQSLAAMGLVEQYHTLHEWRLTSAGEFLSSQMKSRES